MHSVYQLQEKRRKKKNGAISLLIIALLDFFLYAFAQEKITEILAAAAYESGDFEALLTSELRAKSLMTIILIGGIVELIISIVFFSQLPNLDAQIEHARREEQRRRAFELERRMAKMQPAPPKEVATAPDEMFIYCPRCRRKLPDKAIYCASCGHQQK